METNAKEILIPSLSTTRLVSFLRPHLLLKSYQDIVAHSNSYFTVQPLPTVVMLSLKLLSVVLLAALAVAQNTTSSSGSGSSTDNTDFDVNEVNLSERGLLHSRPQALELHSDSCGQWHGVINSAPIVPNCVAGMLQLPCPSPK